MISVMHQCCLLQTCQCQRWIKLKFSSFCQVQNFAGSTLPDNPAAMVPNVLIRMVQIPDMVHRAARQRQKTDNHIFCQKISSDLISSFKNESINKEIPVRLHIYDIVMSILFFLCGFNWRKWSNWRKRIQICPSCFKKKKGCGGSNHIGTHPPTPPSPRFFKVQNPRGKNRSPQFQRFQCQTPDEVEDPSPRYVHIPELMSLKTDMPNKVGQALVDGGEHGEVFPMSFKKENHQKKDHIYIYIFMTFFNVLI